MDKRLTAILILLLIIWDGVLTQKLYNQKKELELTERALVAVTIMAGIYTPADMKKNFTQQLRDAHPIQGSVSRAQLGMESLNARS